MYGGDYTPTISDDDFKNIFDKCPGAILLVLPDGSILDANQTACDILGYTTEELCEKGRSGIIDAEDSRLSVYLKERAANGIASGELIFIRKDEKKFPGSLASQSFISKDGIEKICVIIKDMTELKLAEEKLKKSEQKYHDLFDNARIGLFRSKIDDNTLIDVNQKITKLSGFTKEELLSDVSLLKAVYPEELENLTKKLEKKGSVEEHEISIITKKGNIKTALVSLKIYPDEGYIEGTASDVTQQKKLEKQLKKSLKEKEILLKEIHHRVKNNLSVISSLINLQSMNFDDPEIKTAFMDVYDRSLSMALIHEELYQSNDLKSVNFSDYLKTLCNTLYHSHIIHPRVNLDLNIEKLDVDIEIATPLGLIVNELFTNCMKYAFPDNQTGTITVEFCKEDQKYKLTVQDDGVGLPTNFDIKNTESLGLNLVKNLTNQIDGKLKYIVKNGTRFIIKF
jgi:PAS domain S-box-containing protein